MKGTQLFYKLYKKSVTHVSCCTTMPRKNNPEKKDDRCSHDDDVRAGRGSPCAILLTYIADVFHVKFQESCDNSCCSRGSAAGALLKVSYSPKGETLTAT